ncbi:MAG: TonB-dependent receptor [Gammaproteobacteria bacterium]|nr:TonB-dependent receptor [Gammaproteobacteria bacterium]MBU1414971.1 TonB-dependent receptor [Gammaproteobacteria bacterium]
MRRRWVLVIGAMMMPWGANADELPATETFFDDFPVVLTASRLVQTADEAPASVTVIDRDMIRASGARELVDLFRLVPGMVVGQYLGHQSTLGFNGFADPYFRQLQVLVDGVSIYSSAWGGAEWSDLPIALEDVERIEVVRGPNAATFGANSFLGVVNIITRDPAVEHGAELVANVGENGIRDTYARFAASNENWRYRLTAGQRADQGLDSLPDSRRINFANLRSHYRLNASDELRLQTAYAGGAQEEGIYTGVTDGPRTAHYDYGSLQLRWTRVRSADEELWVQFWHSQRDLRDVVPYVLDLSGLALGQWNYPVSYSYDNRRTDLELQHTFRFADGLRGVWGGQLRSDGVRSETYFGSTEWQTSDLYRLFGNLEWRPAERWIVAGGTMFEKNSITGSSLSPSLAVNYVVFPGHTLRVRFANAHRTPTLYEAEADWGYALPADLKVMLAGTPYANLKLAQSILTERDVEDERIRSRELSYMGQFPRYRLNVEAGLFEHRLTDLIGLYQYTYPTLRGGATGQVRGFDNMNSARVTGSSATIRWRPHPDTLVYLAGSRTTIKADGDGQELIEASGPKYTFSLLVSQALPGNFQVSGAYYYVDAMQSLSGGDSLPPTERIDLRVARHFLVGTRRAELALVVQRANGGEPVFNLNDIDRRTSWLTMRIEF